MTFPMQTPSYKLVGGSLLFVGSLMLACSDSASTSEPTGGSGGTSPSGSGSGGASATASSASSTATGGKTGSAGATGASSTASGSGGEKGGGGTTQGGGSTTSTKGTGGATGTSSTTKGSGGSTSSRGSGGGAPGSGGATSASGSGGGADGGIGSSTGTDGGGASAKSSGCNKAPTLQSSQYNNGSTIAITASGKDRRYILSVPTTYDNTKAYKLVIAFHQLDGNDKQMYSQKYYGLQSLSEDTTIFVAPNGQKNGSACTGTGNGESGCGWPNTSGGDMALADAVVAQVEENFCIDTNRIFATGWSYGASMSYETGCERPLGGGTGGTAGYIRAIAIYSGAQMSGSCKPSTPIGYYASHGTHDSVLKYSGGVTLAQNFATADGCTWATPTSVTSGAHVCTDEAGCKAGYPVKFCSFNGDHTPFPDNGQQSTTWQPPVVWAFFQQF